MSSLGKSPGERGERDLMAGVLIIVLIGWDLQLMSMAKLAAEYMLKKDVIVSAKASAPDF